jgi:anti-sigma B factor antagonist
MCPHPDLFARHLVSCAAWDDCHDRGGWIRVVHIRPGPGTVSRAVGLLRRFPRHADVGDAWQDVPADATAMARDT